MDLAVSEVLEGKVTGSIFTEKEDEETQEPAEEETPEEPAEEEKKE